MKNRKVILCPSSFYPNVGGVEELTLNLAKRLKEKNFEVMILTNRHPSDLSEQEVYDGVPIRRVQFAYPSRKGFLLTHLARILRSERETRRLVAEFKPALIHVICAGPNTLYSWLCNRILNVPIVISTCGERFMDDGGLYKSWFAKRVLSLALRDASACSAVSKFVLNDLANFVPVLPEQNRVIYPAIDIKQSQTQSSMPLNEPPYMLCVARFVENKGLMTLINAFALIARTVRQKLVIAGRGELADSLSKRIDELGLRDKVKLIDQPKRTDVLQMYLDCEFFVLPSPSEPFAIAMLEAMRASKAVVVSDSGGSSELIKTGLNGAIFASGNSESLAEVLSLMCTGELDPVSMGQTARKDVERFDWDTTVNQYEELYALSTV